MTTDGGNSNSPAFFVTIGCENSITVLPPGPERRRPNSLSPDANGIHKYSLRRVWSILASTSGYENASISKTGSENWKSFTSRAISAWQGFGFQLIIAVPEEKYQSVVSKAERVLNIVADANRRSYVSTFDFVDTGEDAEKERG